MNMQSELTADKLKTHMGHKVVIVGYGLKDDSGQIIHTANVSLECETCDELLADADVKEQE